MRARSRAPSRDRTTRPGDRARHGGSGADPAVADRYPRFRLVARRRPRWQGAVDGPAGGRGGGTRDHPGEACPAAPGAAGRRSRRHRARSGRANDRRPGRCAAAVQRADRRDAGNRQRSPHSPGGRRHREVLRVSRRGRFEPGGDHPRRARFFPAGGGTGAFGLPHRRRVRLAPLRLRRPTQARNRAALGDRRRCRALPRAGGARPRTRQQDARL